MSRETSEVVQSYLPFLCLTIFLHFKYFAIFASSVLKRSPMPLKYRMASGVHGGLSISSRCFLIFKSSPQTFFFFYHNALIDVTTQTGKGMEGWTMNCAWTCSFVFLKKFSTLISFGADLIKVFLSFPRGRCPGASLIGLPGSSGVLTDEGPGLAVSGSDARRDASQSPAVHVTHLVPLHVPVELF